MTLAYFSSTSENTKRFVSKLSTDSVRIPLYKSESTPVMESPYYLVTPTYGGKDKWNSAVPKQVIRFLNVKQNRDNLLGVISCGNRNFGAEFCIAGDIISHKTGAPHLYKVELFGTTDDVEQVNALIHQKD